MQHACAVIFGFSYGGYCSAVIVFLKNRFEDCLGMAIGLYFLTCGLASITGPVITGIEKDRFKNLIETQF